MRRLARAGVRGVRLLAADATAAPSGLGARAAPGCAAAHSQAAGAARDAPAAAASRTLTAPSRGLATSVSADKGEAGVPSTQPPHARDAAKPAGEGKAPRSFTSHRTRDARRRSTSPKPAPVKKEAPAILPTNKRLWKLISAGKHKEARALFESWREGNAMDEDGVTALQFLPDVYSYQYYLSTLVSEKGSDKGSANGSLESLDAVLAEMKARGITPKQATFNPFAWLAFNLTDWNMGKRLYETILEHGMVPSDVTYCYFFSLAVAADDVRAAGDMLASAIAANKLKLGKDSTRIASSLNEVFYAAVKKRYLDVAANALAGMRLHGQLPPSASLAELAAVTADVGNLDCALAALDAFSAKPAQFRKTLDEGTVLALLHAATRDRNVALAKAAMAQLASTVAGRGGAPPSAASQVAMVACASVVNDVPAAFRAVNALRELGPAPPAVVRPLVDLLAQGGAAAIDDAYFTAERMHTAGELQGEGAVSVLTAIVAACARARDLNRAFQTFEVMEPTFGVAPTTGAFNALIAACVATKSEAAVAGLVDEMSAKGLQHDDATRALLLEASIMLRDNAGVVALLSAMYKADPAAEMTLVMQRRILTLSQRGDELVRARIEALLENFKVVEDAAPGLRPKDAALW